MPPLSLSPEAVPLLCQLLITGSAALYLLSLPRRTRATRWLGVVLSFSTLFSGAFLVVTLAPAGTVWEIRSTLGIYAALLLTVAAGIQAAYTFLVRPFQRERIVVLALTGIVLLALLVPTVWAFVRADVGLATWLLQPYGVALLIGTIWGISVLGRKSRWLQGLLVASPVRKGARERAVQGVGAFMALLLLELAMAMLNAAVTFGFLPLAALQYGSLLGQIAISVGFVVLVINYAPEPTTVQAKLVGLALATVLAVLGVASIVTLRPAEIAEDAGNVIPPRIALRFEPQENGGYTVEQRRPAATQEVAETTPAGFNLSEGQLESVSLPFAFPFDGRVLREVWAACTPALAMDGEPLLVSSRELLGSGRAAMFAFLGPGRSAKAACFQTDITDLRAVIEWHRLDFAGRDLYHRIVLYPSGVFELVYDGPEQFPFFGANGVQLSGEAPYLPVTLSEGLPDRIPVATGVIEDYGQIYRANAHDRALPFVLLVLGAMGFVLLVFPLFLRRGVLLPLQALLGGVERVQLGDLDARVPVQASDELGLLARAFNGMAGSVQTAEGRLRAYADELETRVVERTAELETSLAELRRTQGTLVETEKMASLGRLTSGIAHEIKNPLNFVINFADIQADLLAELEDALRAGDQAEADAILDDLAQNARAIQAHGSRADGIVRAMQLHARGAASGERIPTDLNAVLRLAASEAEKRHPDMPPVELELDDTIGEVSVAPEGVLQAVVNLLDNALYASRESNGDGQLSCVTLTSERLGDRVCIRVRDCGPGVPEEIRGRLFEPFVTTKPTGEGVGLGLSLAYGIVTAGHGGRLDVESEPGEGATFRVWLPTS
ncbi:MAG: ATP-binding protein [Bacteroidota bacterium]